MLDHTHFILVSTGAVQYSHASTETCAFPKRPPKSEQYCSTLSTPQPGVWLWEGLSSTLQSVDWTIDNPYTVENERVRKRRLVNILLHTTADFFILTVRTTVLLLFNKNFCFHYHIQHKQYL